MMPVPPFQCWLLEADILVNSSISFSSAFNIAMEGEGSHLEISCKNEVCHVHGTLMSLYIETKIHLHGKM